jgi:hypothetical protein
MLETSSEKSTHLGRRPFSAAQTGDRWKQSVFVVAFDNDDVFSSLYLAIVGDLG